MESTQTPLNPDYARGYARGYAKAVEVLELTLSMHLHDNYNTERIIRQALSIIVDELKELGPCLYSQPTSPTTTPNF